MSVHEVAEVLTAIGALIGAVGSTWSTIMSRQNSRDIKDVHTSTNSMKDELVAAVSAQRYAEGLAKRENGNGKE
jgi:hypothetical protein